jgi:hypothetical protein
MHFLNYTLKSIIQVLCYENYNILVLNYLQTSIRLADGNKQDQMAG